MDKSIEERLKEILGGEEKKNEDNFWLTLLPLFLMLNTNTPKEQPIINIYLGSEKDV